MQTIQFQIEDELYENIQNHHIDLQSKFKEFLSTLTDDGSPTVSTEETKKRVSEAMDSSMQTVSHDDMWSSIDSDCNVKVEDDTIHNDFEQTKIYFHKCLENIENGNTQLLSQDQYNSQMNDFKENLKSKYANN